MSGNNHHPPPGEQRPQRPVGPGDPRLQGLPPPGGMRPRLPGPPRQVMPRMARPPMPTWAPSDLGARPKVARQDAPPTGIAPPCPAGLKLIFLDGSSFLSVNNWPVHILRVCRSRHLSPRHVEQFYHLANIVAFPLTSLSEWSNRCHRKMQIFNK
jgi:hypothetical protein